MKSDSKDFAESAEIEFPDNEKLLELLGSDNTHINDFAHHAGVKIFVRGNRVVIKGEKQKVLDAKKALKQIYLNTGNGFTPGPADLKAALKFASASQNDLFDDLISLPGSKKSIVPRTPGQKEYLKAIAKNDLVIGVGPAGTGKTYLAMAMAVSALMRGEVERLILTRPAIEAGEKLGFLPGDLAEKVNPYLRPLYDAMHDMLDFGRVQSLLQRGQIEVAPLAFMRGRTLNNAFVILDEAQNCTIEQMKMFLTRFGMSSKVVVTGDTTQIDLPREKKSGLVNALKILKDVEGICIYSLNETDIVRHPLVRKIIQAYDQDMQKTREQS